MDILSMPMPELKKLYLALDDSVNVIGCFGPKDVLMLVAVGDELERRGVEMRTRAEFV